MPIRTGKDNQPKDDASPTLPAVPVKKVSDQVQKMSEDESENVDDSTKKAQEMSGEESDTMEVSTKKESDVVDDSTKKAQEMSGEDSDTMEVSTKKVSDVADDSTKKDQEMSGEESDTMDISTEKAKMSDVVDDSTTKAQDMSGEESDTMEVSTEKPKISDVIEDSTEKVKKTSDDKTESTTKAPEVSDANEDSSEKAQKTPDAGDCSPEEAQKKSEGESEVAEESTEDVLLNTSSILDIRILLIPVGKNKVGELYFWQPSYPAFSSPPKNVASGSLKWHQKEESGNTLVLDASLAMSDDYSFLHAVVEESSRQRVVWKRPTSQLVHPSGASKGTMVWQARTTLRHSADLSFHAHDLEQRRAVLLVPFIPDAPIRGSAPGRDEGSVSRNQSPTQSAEASSEAETSDDTYAGSSPKKPRLE